ncbi:hypothetical protein CA982_26105, partial [Gordonia lacunae]
MLPVVHERAVEVVDHVLDGLTLCRVEEWAVVHVEVVLEFVELLDELVKPLATPHVEAAAERV